MISEVLLSADETREKIVAALEASPGAVLEHVARELNVTTADVVAALPADEVVSVGAERFEDVMMAATELGNITFIVQTEDIVLECKGPVPAGSFGRGYYNIHGESPIGGHIKAENCGAIFFISRKLMGRLSHSIQFYNKLGGCIYKIYLGRDENRELIPQQVTKFMDLKARFETS